MGDGFDPWGGLPDRPKPYFTHQRKGTKWQRLPSTRTRGDVRFAASPEPRRRPVKAALLLLLSVAAALALLWHLIPAPGVPTSKPTASLETAVRPRGYQDTGGAWHLVFAWTDAKGVPPLDDAFRSIDEIHLGRGDVVLLSGDGGSPDDAIRVGREIRRRGLYTAVGSLDRAARFAPARCSGGCLLAFAGGVERLSVGDSTLAPGSLLDRSGDASPDLAAYLEAMGVDPSALDLGASDATHPGSLSTETLASTRLATLRLPGL